MSTATATPKPGRPPRNGNNGASASVPSGYKQVVEVVKAQGPWSGFNPLAGHGHKFILDPEIAKNLSVTHFRMWGWLFEHTNANGCADYTEEFGYRSPFAVVRKDGTIEAHLEHMAADLDIEIHNLRKYWNHGVSLGIWRNGTDLEGARRMYLTTEVPKSPEGPEKPTLGVCTYPWERLPGYLAQHLKTLPATDQREFWDEYAITEAVESLLIAELVAGGRETAGQEKDNLFRRYGTEKKTQKHKKNGVTDEDAQARSDRMAKHLQPVLQGYVHTLREYVRSDFESPYKPTYEPQTEDASLLGLETIQRGAEAGGLSSLHTSPSHQEPQGSPEVKTCKQLPAQTPVVSSPRGSQNHQNGTAKNGKLKLPASRPRVLATEEAEAERILFSALRAMQEAYKHCDFSAELLEPRRKTDQIIVRRIMDIVRPENVGDFLAVVRDKFLGLDKNGLGKKPARSPGMPSGPRSVGLIVIWARDYADKLDEAARRTAAQKAEQDAYELRACLELIADPKETVEARRWAVERAAELRGEGGNSNV